MSQASYRLLYPARILGGRRRRAVGGGGVRGRLHGRSDLFDGVLMLLRRADPHGLEANGHGGSRLSCAGLVEAVEEHLRIAGRPLLHDVEGGGDRP
ncbi:MAG: hypothetical protein ACK4YQ_16920 [Phenylobacterium sp.]|uniref:hypothetical protein n=1 Tax=Phenylobacterium sp. TaxID=1871053 RepID=UPI00391AC684